MTDSGDLEGVIPPRISDDDAERLLSGESASEHHLADVSAVFEALRSAATGDEMSGLDAVVAGFGVAPLVAATGAGATDPKPIVRKLLSGRTIAAVGVATLISAGAAAAAGVVPTPFSSSFDAPRLFGTSTSTAAKTHASDDAATIVASSTDVDTTQSTDPSTTDSTATTEPADSSVPPSTDDTADDTAPAAAAASAADTTPNGPDVTGPAQFGLCTAFEARSKAHDGGTDATDATDAEAADTEATDDQGGTPISFKALADAAAAAGMTVADFCAEATPGGKPAKADDSSSSTEPVTSVEPSDTGTAPDETDDDDDHHHSPATTGAPDTEPEKSGGDHGRPATTHP